VLFQEGAVLARKLDDVLLLFVMGNQGYFHPYTS
jgi:hypothetical protein